MQNDETQNPTHDVAGQKPVDPYEIVILVNRHKVVFKTETSTGYTVKLAAIAQGVPNVQADFDLFKVEGDKQTLIENQEPLHLHSKDVFLMLTPDHSS